MQFHRRVSETRQKLEYFKNVITLKFLDWATTVVGSEATQHNPHFLFNRPRSYLQAENFNWTSSDFWNPSWKGKRKEGNLNLPTTTTTRSSRSEHWAGKSQVQTDTTVVLHAPNSGLRLERERGLNYFYLPQKSSSHGKLQFRLLLNCTRDYLLHEISFSSSEDQSFSGCKNRRSDSLSAFFLSSYSFVKVKSPASATCTPLEHQPKGDGRPPDLHLNCLCMCRHLTLLRTST